MTGLDAAFMSSLAANGLSITDPGVAWGDAIGAAIVALRGTDGAAQAQFSYSAPGAGDIGVWVPIGAAAPVCRDGGGLRPGFCGTRRSSSLMPPQRSTAGGMRATTTR